MFVRCSVLERMIPDEKQSLTKSYGLKFYESDACDHTIRLAHDLFFQKEQADDAARLINENDLCDVHITAVIEDLINEPL